MVNGFPKDLLARSSLPGRWSIGPAGLSILLALGDSGFQGGQALGLQSGEAVTVEETAYRLAAQVNSLPFRQHLGEVAVVEAGVFLGSQDDHGVSDLFGNSIAGLATSIAVGQCGRILKYLVIDNFTPGVATADPLHPVFNHGFL